MMLTRRQQFRRCRVRRRGASPVKGRRGSADGSSYCGSELGSFDTMSFRTAHSHAGGGGGDSCCVSPLSSVGSSPCPPGSPLPPLAEAGPSTLGLTGSPPPMGPPPPHPLALASPAEPTLARQGSGESHDSLGSAAPSSGSSGVAARWWHLLGHSTFPSPLAMWSNPAYHAELTSPGGTAGVTRPLAKRPSQIVVVETGNSPLPPPSEEEAEEAPGQQQPRPAMEELSVCSPTPSPVPAPASSKSSFGRALLGFFGFGRRRRGSSGARLKLRAGCDAALAAPLKPPAGAGALDAGAESDPDSPTTPGSPVAPLVVRVSPLPLEAEEGAAGKGASHDGGSGAENPATPSTTGSDGEADDEDGDRGFARPASPLSPLVLPTATEEEAAVAAAEGSEADGDGDYSDEDEDEDEEGLLEERGPGRVRFSNVDRLVLIPALCDMDAATHKRLYWCTEDYEAIRRSALAEMKAFNIRNFGAEDYPPPDFYDPEEGVDADRWGMEEEEEEEEALSETGSVIRHPVPTQQGLPGLGTAAEAAEPWEELVGNAVEGEEEDEDGEGDEEATAATSTAAATVSSEGSSSSTASSDPVPAPVKAAAAAVAAKPRSRSPSPSPSPRPTSPLLVAALAAAPTAAPRPLELPPALAFAVKKAAAAAGGGLAMPLPERGGRPPRFAGQCSSAPTSRSPSPSPSRCSSPGGGMGRARMGEGADGPSAPFLWGKTLQAAGEAPADPRSYLSHDAAAHLFSSSSSGGKGHRFSAGGRGRHHHHHHHRGGSISGSLGRKRGLLLGAGYAGGRQGLVGALDLATAQNRHPPEFLSPPLAKLAPQRSASLCGGECGHGACGRGACGACAAAAAEDALTVGGCCEVSAVDLAAEEILELSRSQQPAPKERPPLVASASSPCLAAVGLGAT